MAAQTFVKGKFLSKESNFLDRILTANYGLAKKISVGLNTSNTMVGHYKSGAVRIKPELFKEILNIINKELGTEYIHDCLPMDISNSIGKHTIIQSTIKDKKLESLMDDFLSTSASIKIKFLLNIYPNIFDTNNYSEIFTMSELEKIINTYNSL